MTSLRSLVPFGILKKWQLSHIITGVNVLMIGVKVVLILSGMVHLAPGGKNSIVTVNFVIPEGLFLQGLIFHLQEGIYNCAPSYISN